jgi:hypothetical protein
MNKKNHDMEKYVSVFTGIKGAAQCLRVLFHILEVAGSNCSRVTNYLVVYLSLSHLL